MNKNSVHDLSDDQLLMALKNAAACERAATAGLIALLAEVDARRLYLGQGYSSLFVYCTQCLHLSEHAAYGRIEAARAARKFPLVIELLADGGLTLTTVCLLASHLTPSNHRQLLEAARHKSKREVEQQVAALHPSPAVPSTVRKLPQPNPQLQTTTSAADARVTALRGAVSGGVPQPSEPVRRESPPGPTTCSCGVAHTTPTRRDSTLVYRCFGNDRSAMNSVWTELEVGTRSAPQLS